MRGIGASRYIGGAKEIFQEFEMLIGTRRADNNDSNPNPGWRVAAARN